jgi:hypothetical protein
MYQVRADGGTKLENSSLAVILEEATKGFQQSPKSKPAELWQDGRYVASLVWNGTSLEVHWCGD